MDEYVLGSNRQTDIILGTNTSPIVEISGNFATYSFLTIA